MRMPYQLGLHDHIEWIISLGGFLTAWKKRKTDGDFLTSTQINLRGRKIIIDQISTRCRNFELRLHGFVDANEVHPIVTLTSFFLF